MIEEMMRRYWPKWSGSVVEGTGGWNNTTYFIKDIERSCVLRLYDTHRDRDKIEFEHAVLESLQHEYLSFKVPIIIKTQEGETIVQVEDGSGRFACLFQYIEGTSPKDSSAIIASSFGESVGELSAILATTNPGVSPVYRPYYELEHSYPMCTQEVVLDFCTNPPKEFNDLYKELHILGVTYKDICDSLAGLEKLPQQLVHGDLNESNLLVHGDNAEKIIALIDFEFCTLDVRAMEPAVVISGLLSHNDEVDTVRKFCTGFGSWIRLTPEEIVAIPVLMRLRKMDVFLHFLSRFLKGTDEPKILREQVPSLVIDLKQLANSRTWIEEELIMLLGSK